MEVFPCSTNKEKEAALHHSHQNKDTLLVFGDFQWESDMKNGAAYVFAFHLSFFYNMYIKNSF